MQQDASNTMRMFTPWRVACLLTLLIAGAAYLPSMSGLAIWDDHALIGGPGIGGGKSLAACFTQPFLLHYFRPLVSVSFFLDHRAFGTGPFFYHQTNLLIHVLTTLVCLALFRAAFRSRSVALAGALAFAVQPTQVSTVAWIGGRTDSLCTLWVSLFAWTLICGAQGYGKARAAWLTASTLAFGLALLTKEQALSLLPLVPLAFRCFSRFDKRRAWRDGLRCTLPFAAMGAAFITAWFEFYPSPYRPVMHGVSDQAALAGRTLVYYAFLLAAPAPRWMHLLSLGTLERWGFGCILAGYAALGLAVAWCVRGVQRYPAGAWFGAFVLLDLLPVSNLVPLPSLVVAPYRAGVAGLGAAALLGYLFAAGWRRDSRALSQRKNERTAEARFDQAQESSSESGIRSWFRQFSIRSAAPKAHVLLPALGGLFLLWCGSLTWWGAAQWQDERTIFSAIVRYDPDSIVGRFNLTTALLKQHKTKPALRELDALMTQMFGSSAWKRRNTVLAALSRNPAILNRIRENQGNAIEPRSWLAALYAQMGFADLNNQDRAAAKRSFEIGRAIDAANDDINLGLGQMAYDAGDYRRAAGYLRISLSVRPRRAEAHMLLGHTLAAKHRWRQAQSELETWAEIQPWSGQAMIEVAQAKCRLGDYAGAKANLEYALAHSICDVGEVRARLHDLHGRGGQFLN